MRTVAGRTLNEIYREHLFQLALTFHGGMEVVAYEWGAPTWLEHLSPDDEAQSQLAAAYSRFGGGWSTSKPYQFGTMVGDSCILRLSLSTNCSSLSLFCVQRTTWSIMSVGGWRIGHMQDHSIPIASSHVSPKSSGGIQDPKRHITIQLFECSTCSSKLAIIRNQRKTSWAVA